MKTSIFRLICGVLSIGFLFSSCLGDNDSGILETGGDYVFITSFEDRKVAAVATYQTYITTDQIELSTTEIGKVYTMGYKINTSNTIGNLYLAEDMGDPIKEIPQTKGIIGAPAIEDNFTPTLFRIGFFTTMITDAKTGANFFGDRWVFKADAQLKEYDATKMSFYYDPTNQKEEVSGVVNEIGDNKIIIDVRFTKTTILDGAQSNKTVSGVGNFSDIRSYFQYNSNKLKYGDKDFVYVPIKFRYNRIRTEGGKDIIEETIDGNWNTDSTGKYFMLFVKPS